MRKAFSTNLVIFLSLIFVSCSAKDDQKTKIRIVNMQGKPGKVITKVPDLNLQAMASQNRLKQEQMNFQSSAATKTDPQQQLAQNPADNSDIRDQNLAEPPSFGQPVLQNKVESPQRLPQKEVSQKTDLLVGAGTMSDKSQTVEYDFSKLKKTTTDKLANDKIKEGTGTKKIITKKGVAVKARIFFVQVGSFSKLSNANNLLDSMQKFYPGKVETVTAEKTIYRVLLGPFSSRKKAGEIIKKITASGTKAILVRGS
jgi:cell division protein FtsN